MLGLSNGTIFLIIVFGSFFFVGTNIGARESKFSLPFMLCYLVVVGTVLMFLWSGAHVAVTR